MEIIYGTGNQNKVISMTKILKENDVDAKIYTLKDIGFNQEIIEDGKTFEENSEIKAKAIKKFCDENNINAQVSLEEKMGCGLGVCLGCAVKTAKSPKEAPEYFHVCKGGPVFNSKDVEF